MEERTFKIMENVSSLYLLACISVIIMTENGCYGRCSKVRVAGNFVSAFFASFMNKFE